MPLPPARSLPPTPIPTHCPPQALGCSQHTPSVCLSLLHVLFSWPHPCCRMLQSSLTGADSPTSGPPSPVTSRQVTASSTLNPLSVTSPGNPIVNPLVKQATMTMDKSGNMVNPLATPRAQRIAAASAPPPPPPVEPVPEEVRCWC
jgi:hypothetical protein